MKIIPHATARQNIASGAPQSYWAVPFRDPKIGYDDCKPGMGGYRAFTDDIQPIVKPKFSLPANASFFAAGSCFARNVERALSAHGLQVNSLTHDPEIPPSLFNRYTTGSIINDFRFAISGYDSRLALPVNDKWMDWTFYGRFDTRESLLSAREKVVNIHKLAFQSNVIVLTLGLVESWYDKHVNEYCNISPCHSDGASESEIEEFRNRYELRILSYEDNLSALGEFLKLMESHAQVDQKFIITVSPVPFNATFSGQDVMIANMYSKSTLRAVAEDFAAMHNNVDYYPSYEMVCLSDPKACWHPDYRHVKPGYVAQIMRHFIANYILPHVAVTSNIV